MLSKLSKPSFLLLDPLFLGLRLFQFPLLAKFNILSEVTVGGEQIDVRLGGLVGHEGGEFEIEIDFRVKGNTFGPLGFHITLYELEVFFSKAFELFKPIVRLQYVYESIHVFFFQRAFFY